MWFWNSSVNVDPQLSSEVAVMPLDPSYCASLLEIARPMPKPVEVALLASILISSKTFRSYDSLIPTPVSETLIEIRSDSSIVTAILTSPW